MKYIIGVVLTFFAIVATWAGEPIDQKIETDDDITVLVENVHGSVQVTGTDLQEVHVTGELGDGAERVVVSEEYGRVLVRVLMPRSGSSDETELMVSAPAASRLIVETVSADIEISGMNGTQRLNTVGGDVKTHSTGENLEVKSATGDILVTGGGTTTDSTVTSVSGDVIVSGLAGDVSAKSVSGDVSVEGTAISQARLSSTSGDLLLTASVDSDPRLVLESISGDAMMEVEGNLAGEFDVKTTSGQIESCFGPEPARDEFGAGESLRFTDEEGEAAVRVKTMSGDINLFTSDGVDCLNGR